MKHRHTVGKHEQRKHRCQMTAVEVERVERLIHRVPSWSVLLADDHARQRLMDKAVRLEEVHAVLEAGRLVEVRRFSTGLRDVRATLRGNVEADSVCVCVSLNGRKVVTVWRNNLDDDHDTLNLSNYTWRANMEAVVAKALEERR